MKSLLRIFAGMLIGFLPFSHLLAQEEVSSFPQKLNLEAQAFVFGEPMENEVGTLLLFNTNNTFELKYLDAGLQLVDQTSIRKSGHELSNLQIKGLLNFPDSLHIFFTLPGNNLLRSLTIDKAAGTYRQHALNFLQGKHFRTLKAFTHNDHYYLFPVLRKKENVQLHIYEFDDATTYRFHEYSILAPEFAKALQKGDDLYIPRASEDRESSIAANALKIKLYTFDQEFIFTYEEEDKGETQFVVINTESWLMTSEIYPIPGFVQGAENQNVNSLIYDGILYQAAVSDSGLTVASIDMEQKEEIARLKFRNDQEIFDTFGPIYRKKFTTEGFNLSRQNGIIKQLKRSLSLSMRPRGEEKTALTVGAHLYMKEGTRNAFSLVAMLASAASYAGAGIPVTSGGATVVFDPFSTIATGFDMAAISGNDRFFFTEAIVDPIELGILQTAIPASNNQNALDYLISSKIGRKGRGQVMFEIGDRYYFGYGLKKVYHILEFR